MTAKRLGRWLFFLSFALALWGYFYPRPYGLCIAVLIAIPWLVIAAIAVSRGKFRMFGPDTGQLFSCVIFPGIVLGYRAFLDLEPETWTRATLMAFGLGALFLALAAWEDRTLRNIWGLFIFLPIIAVIYGYGAVLEANLLLDSSAPQHFTPLVVSRVEWRGRNNMLYRIKLAPWGNHAQSTADFVGLEVYYALRTGSAACVDLGGGAFDIPWHTIRACQPSRRSYNIP